MCTVLNKLYCSVLHESRVISPCDDDDDGGDGDGDDDGVATTARSLLEAHMADLLSALHARLTSKFGGDAAKALNAAGTGEARAGGDA